MMVTKLTDGKYNNQSIERLLSSITERDLNHCINALEDVAKDGVVGMNEFILFLEDFSGRALAFNNFEDIPSSLVMIYYTAACFLNDHDCDTDDEEEPKMYIDDMIKNAPGVLTIFCQSVKDVGAIQISLHFQFQIQYNDDGSDQEILSEYTSTGIRRNLELATEESLLNRLGCTSNDEVRRRVTENLSTMLVDESLNRVMKHQNERQVEQLGVEVSVVLNTSASCDYNVHTRISNLIESGTITSALFMFPE
jgi:hypothetical protein